MFILNTTFVIDSSLETDFIKWAKEVYLPAMAAAGIFTPATIARVLTRLEQGVDSFAVQAFTASLEPAQRWHDETAALLRDDLQARYGERVMHFSTYMEVISHEG